MEARTHSRNSRAPPLVQEEVLINQNKPAHFFPALACFPCHRVHGLEKLPAGLEIRDIFPLEEMGSAAEIAPVGAPQSCGQVANESPRLEGIGANSGDGGIGVLDGPVHGLIQEPAHEGDPFFPAHVVGEGSQQFLGKNGPIAAEDDFRVWRIPANQLDHPADLVKGRNDKADPHIIIPAGSELARRTPFRRDNEARHRASAGCGRCNRWPSSE